MNYEDACLLPDAEGEEAVFVSVLHFLKSPSGTRASPHVLVDSGDDPEYSPTVQEEVPPPYKLLFVRFNIFCTFFVKYKHIFSRGQNRLSRTTLPILTLRLRKICLNLASSVSEPPTT